MKKIFISFLIILSLSGCEQTQEQTQVSNNYYTERPNFNSVPWASIDLIRGIGESKINKIKAEFKKGEFRSGKDFERRMEKILSPEIIGKIGDKYNFEEVH